MRIVGVALLLCSSIAFAQSSGDGEALFNSQCAGCHNGSGEGRAPTPEVLRAFSPAAILDVLSNGAMRVQGSRLSGEQRHLLAEYLSGKEITGDSTGAAVGRCASNPVLNANVQWNGWGASARNERFQSAKAAGLKVSDLPKLKLKWAFGFPDATSAWATPSVVGGRVFVGSQNGTVYSLDQNSGCIYWYFSADGGVRTAITFVQHSDGPRVYFGDTSANVYAIDAHDGSLKWKVKAESHPMARITGSIAVFGEQLFVPMSSYEESQMRNPDYLCCNFRGSVTAIDAKTGHINWHSYTIPDEPKPQGPVSEGGMAYMGPSGAAVWSPPTIDAKRNVLYVSTGNGYTGPPNPYSDAVIAMDLDSGSITWVKQLHENDVYIGSCWSELDETKAECKEKRGPDYDIGNPPILATLPNGKERLIIGQKSGIGWALDPDKRGEIVWQYRAGRGGGLGGMEWGSAVDATNAYFPVSDIFSPKPGGLHAVNLQSGKPAWVAPPAVAKCPPNERCNAAQAAAITVIEGAVFSGSNDGVMRAYSTVDGKVVWEVDTNGDYETVNGIPGKGSSMICPGPTIANGMVLVSSGYGAFGGRPGNVLLAYGLDHTQP